MLLAVGSRLLSVFVMRCLSVLFAACRLFDDVYLTIDARCCCLMCVVCCLYRCALFAVRCVAFVVLLLCCLLFVVLCVVVRCCLCMFRCLLCVVCRSLPVV